MIDDGMESVRAALDDLHKAKLKDAYVIKDVIEAAMSKSIQRGCRQRPVVLAVVVPEKE